MGAAPRGRGDHDDLQRVSVILHVLARDGRERLRVDEGQEPVAGPQTSRRYSRRVFALSAFVPDLSQSRITAASASLAGIVGRKFSPISSRASSASLAVAPAASPICARPPP